MKLLTKEIKKKIPKLYATEKIPLHDKVAVCKFFTPWTSWTWYVAEGQETEDGDFRFWGFVDNGDPVTSEWGYFLLSELESIRGSVSINGRKSPACLTIERDKWFDPRKMRDFHPSFRHDDDKPLEVPEEKPNPSVKEMALKMIQQEIEELIDEGDWS